MQLQSDSIHMQKTGNNLAKQRNCMWHSAELWQNLIEQTMKSMFEDQRHGSYFNFIGVI